MESALIAQSAPSATLPRIILSCTVSESTRLVDLTLCFIRGSRNDIVTCEVFEKECYVNSFMQGKLYLNSLPFFKNLEKDNDEGRSDRYEGSSLILQPKFVNASFGGFDIPQHDFAGPIIGQPDELNLYHVLCLHAVHGNDFTNPSHENIDGLKKHMQISDKCRQFGDFVVMVTDAAAFFRRIKSAADSQSYRRYKSLVQYYNPDTFHGQFDGVEAIFRKRDEYKYQREYRIAIKTGKGPDPITFDIGDISDITTRYDIDSINRDIYTTLSIS